MGFSFRFMLAMVLCLMMAGVAVAETPAVYTKDNVPAIPRLEDMPLQPSVSQHGITWTFDKPARVGRFVNGDYYVVGASTIQAIDPKTLVDAEVSREQIDSHEKRRINTLRAVRNGSMLNPPAARALAFDSGIQNWFRREGLATFPLAMKPGDSLVSTISLKIDESAKFVYHSGGRRDADDNCPIKVAAVLTCVAEPLPADAFRPGYCDRAQTIYLARNLKRELLPRLAKAAGAPDPVTFAEVFQKPWLNLGFFGFDQPMENMPHYGQWVGQAVSNAALLLCFDYTPEQKERLLLNFTQVGIDYWGMVKSGHPGWECWGGHGSGRKLPIVFAGHLLGDEKMASPTKTFPKVLFAEDNQTRYGQCWTGAKVVFAGHSGVHGNEVPQPPRGPYEHLHPSQWDRNGQTNFVSEAYRRANTSCCWVGEGLALRLLSLEGNWNHGAFFDYVDRWMTEDDEPFRKVIAPFASGGTAASLRDPTKTWFHEGYAGEDWIKLAWNQHRAVSRAPTDGWKKDHGEEAAMLGADPAKTPRGGQSASAPSPAVPNAPEEKLLVLNIDAGVALNLVLIPAGKFQMGSPESEQDRAAYEEGAHEVTIAKPFHMGVTEVTQEQYEAVMGNNPSEFKGKKRPVEQVSWNDAVEFCKKLSAKTRQAVRLPTEAEWEYACRAGTKTAFQTGPVIVSTMANFDGTQRYGTGGPGPYLRTTMAVGSFPANAFGLHDMHGNVAEWCSDLFAGKTPDGAKAEGPAYILRGGSWYDGPRDCRCASRYWLKPDGKLSDFGFRVVVAP